MKAGDIYSVIGAGLPAARARSIAATAVAVDGSGNLLVLDDTFVRALATKKGQFFGLPMQPGQSTPWRAIPADIPATAVRRPAPSSLT